MAGQKWVVDFETTTKAEDCRVWSWGACLIDDPNKFVWGKDIDSFLQWCKENDNPKCFFHNLKFDSQFIISRIMNLGFTWCEEKALRENTFSTLITASGDYFSVRVVFKKKNHHIRKVEFFDSMKLIQNSVDGIAKSFGIPFTKQKIDYHKERPVGYTPTPTELAYLNADCKIVAIALSELFKLGMDGITIGQMAMKDFKNRNKRYSSYFPTLDKIIESDIRQAYKGGFTYLNPEYKERETESGFFLDKNSMFPTMLLQKELPIGRPMFFSGQYEQDDCYPLYIQKMSFSAVLKEGKVPFLRSHNCTNYAPLDYIVSTKGEIVTFTLTTPEIELLFENYDVEDLFYHSGWKFSSSEGIFDEYVNHWSSQKELAKEEGNMAKYQISKMFLNSLIGKFGARGTGRQKMPIMNEEGVVEYKPIGKEDRRSVYSPIALFTTAYARCDLVRTIEKIRGYGFKKYGRDVYVYSDTDSIACTLNIEDLEEIDKQIQLDDKLLGAWKLEKVFCKARFLHAKCYMIIDESGIPHATVAGMPKELSKRMNFENFAVGFTTEDMKNDPELEDLLSKQQVNVRGGVILENIPFTIQ